MDTITSPLLPQSSSLNSVFSGTDNPLAAVTKNQSTIASANPTLNYSDFSNVTNLQLNGTAKQIISGKYLNLNAALERNQNGSVYYNSPFNFDSNTSFSTHFEAQIQGTAGITFLLQNDSRGDLALGDLGGSYGYGDTVYNNSATMISKSVAIELGNIQSPNQVALLLNGNVTQPLTSSTFSTTAGAIVDTWVDYNAATQNLNVYLSSTTSKPTTATLSYQVNLTQVLGNQFYTGFTAGTLRGSNPQSITNINNWSFTAQPNTVQPQIPPPQASFSPAQSNTIQNSSSSYTYTFNVTYQDPSGLNTSSINSQNIQVTGPGFGTNPVLATLTSTSANANNTQVNATYSINAPNNIWTSADNGTYIVNLLPNQVSDLLGSSNSTITTLGTFSVNINQDVLTQGNNITRSKIDPNETTLNQSNVNSTKFGLLSQLSVDGQVYAQPLYKTSVNIGGTLHNVVYIATMHNSVYAYDADNYSLLWADHLGNAVQLPDPNIGGGNAYGDITGEDGILSTPVISADGQSMYFVDFQKNPTTGVYSYQLHDVSTITGTDQIAPVTINASVQGTGYGNVNGQLVFTPDLELQRPGLLLANGNVYMAFSSFADVGLYHGWIFSYSATNLTQQAVYNASPNGYTGGIWQTGTGLSTDSSGNIYVVVGNGANIFNNANLQQGEYGDSVIKFNANLQVEDYFTPSNYNVLNDDDLDLTTGVTFIPGTNLVTAIGKTGELYVLNSNNLGKLNPNADGTTINNSQIVQDIPNATNGVVSQPIYYKGILYISDASQGIFGYQFNSTTGLFNTTPIFHTSGASYPGFELSITSNNEQSGTDILWAVQAGYNPQFTAYDPATLQPLWNINWYVNNGSTGYVDKFNNPTIANGKVFLATSQGALNVYGELN